MTKLIAPLQSGQASGKYQNLVFARNQFGQYSRDYVAATNPNSTDQQTFRNAFQTTANLWNNTAQISQAERDGWNNFAKINPVQDRFGNQRFMSGYNWFMKLNMPRAVAGFGAHHFPPASTVADYLPAVTIFRRGNGDLVASVDPLPTGDAFLIFSYVENQNVGRSFRPNKTKFAGACTSASADPFVLIDDATLSATEKRQFITYTAYNQVGIGTPKREYNQITGPAVMQELEISAWNEQQSDNPNSVNEGGGNTVISDTSSSVRRIYFNFDISIIKVPSITQGNFNFNIWGLSGEPLQVRWRVGLLNNNKDFLTWNDRLDSTTWNTPGCGVGDDLSDQIDAAKVISSTGSNTMDLKDLLNFMIENNLNEGLQMRIVPNGDQVCGMTGTGEMGPNHPNLIITYYENP